MLLDCVQLHGILHNIHQQQIVRVFIADHAIMLLSWDRCGQESIRQGRDFSRAEEGNAGKLTVLLFGFALLAPQADK
jgi:hypothetical protein